MMATALMLVLSSPAAADLQGGLDAYHAENFSAAAQALGPLAEAGDADAQYRLGMMYDFGQGVQKDPAESARWLRLAAVQGLPEAQFALGMKYDVGIGVPWSPAEAHWWVRQAANQGYFDALNWLVNNGECNSC
jgi:TPR repeat protein